MSKIVLSPLTPAEIKARDEQEDRLNAGLLKCWRGNDFDKERAQKLLRAYAIEIFNTICGFYRKKIGFHAEWLPEIVNEATYRARIVYGRHRNYNLNLIQDSLKITVTEDLRTRGTSESTWSEFHRVFQAKDPAFDPNPDDSPLLRDAKVRAKQMMSQSVPKRPPVFVNVPQKPKRISAHITSLSAAEKAQEFMDAHSLNQTEFAIRSNTSDKTMRKFLRTGEVKRSIVRGIASAMGITVEELLRH